MGRNYKRKLGSRTFKDYTDETLAEALKMVTEKVLTQNQAAKRYKIPRGTIQNKMKGQHLGLPGHPLAFSKIEESSIVSHLKCIGEFGFPVCRDDLRIIAKSYLDRKGILHKAFKNNYPGEEWIRGFISRHKKELSLRLAANINTRRYEITREEMITYMDNLKTSLKDILPQNIINYDESAMSDDPGRKKCFFQKGTKYAEKHMNTTKSNISVMFAASASGSLLPPFIIYKAKNIYEGWTEDGPDGARYSATEHGWFDSVTFLNWFQSIIVPYRQENPGKFAIIGDNLSSHISEEVIKLAKENDIDLVFLPPNSTHISQPLDVSVFRSLKSRWREVLGLWKSENIRKTSLEKSIFPSLLKSTLNQIPNMSLNILSGFRTTGIFPLNKNELLKKFPDPEETFDVDLMSNSFTEHISKTRNTTIEKKKRGKKFNVIPGKSVCNPISNNNQIEDMEIEEGTSQENPGVISTSANDIFQVPQLILVTEKSVSQQGYDKSYVLVKYPTEKNRILHFVGFVQELKQDGQLSVKFLRKSGILDETIFSEPYIEDISEIDSSQVLVKLPEPIKLSRGRYKFNYSFTDIENLM